MKIHFYIICLVKKFFLPKIILRTIILIINKLFSPSLLKLSMLTLIYHKKDQIIVIVFDYWQLSLSVFVWLSSKTSNLSGQLMMLRNFSGKVSRIGWNSYLVLELLCKLHMTIWWNSFVQGISSLHYETFQGSIWIVNHSWFLLFYIFLYKMQRHESSRCKRVFWIFFVNKFILDGLETIIITFPFVPESCNIFVLR